MTTLGKPGPASDTDAGRPAPRPIGAFELALVCVLALAVLLPGMWSYTLIDPWETHYAEVGRRMLQDDDWVHTKWQAEGFRSKPVLTFWLMAGSMQAHGVGDGGGFSGEMVTSDLVVFAVRLPFVLFGALGIVLAWWMLARLISRRVAWLSFLVMVTTPFYFFVARQAITDMPMIACVIGAMACFAMAIEAGESPLRTLWRPRLPRWLSRFGGRGDGRAPRFARITGLHLFLAVLVAAVGWQAIYYGVLFYESPRVAHGIRFPNPHLVIPLVMLLVLGAIVAWLVLPRARLHPHHPRYWLQVVFGAPVVTRRQLFMLWFYAFVGISVLAKGIIGLGMIGLVCLLYLALTGQWRYVLHLEIPRGLVLVTLIVVPWHVAMWLRDGPIFFRRYVMQHNFGRATDGMHGPRGTFNFYVSQLGPGLWPWIALLPGALAGLFGQVTARTREGRVRLLVGIWATVAVTTVSLVTTKFHHYVLPAIPAMCILLALWLDDVLAGRVRRIGMVCALGAGVVLLVMRDLMDKHELWVNMFIYRYDRKWPTKDPWAIDLSDGFLAFGLVFAVLLLLFPARALRRWALAGLGVAALAAMVWASNVYMAHAATHWGMRDGIRSYYQLRTIHGEDIRYHGARQLADDWDGFTGLYEIRTVIPDTLTAQQPVTVRIELTGFKGGAVVEEFALAGQVARIGEHRFWVEFAPGQVEALATAIAEGRTQPRSPRRPWRQVNADRLIAWQLYWRGENFWTGDEIWGQHPETRTAFMKTDNKEFLKYLKDAGLEGRRYFVMTEAGRANNLRNVLPTPTAKATWEVLDTTSNKFTLLTFVL